MSRNFEYDMKQALGACPTPQDKMALIKSVTNWPRAVVKELTIQVPTNDIGTKDVERIWNVGQFSPFAYDAAVPESGIIDVGVNTFTPGGQLGAAMCVMAVGCEFMGEPEVWTLSGTSFKTAELTEGTAVPVSPDAFTQEDVVPVGAANGALGASAVPAVLDYGTESWRFAENYTRATNFVWQVSAGYRVMDMPTEDVASCGPKGGPRGLGRNDVATAQYVQRVNEIYSGLPGFSGRTFIAQNAVRDGFVPGGLSTYIPSRAGDFAKESFGSERRSGKLYTNDCCQNLGQPLYLREGLPIQIFFAKQSGNEYMDRALANLGSSYNGEMTQIDADTFAFSPAAVADAHFNEWDSRAAAPAAVQHGVVRNRIYYKFGYVRMRVCLYGMILVDEALHAMIGGLRTTQTAQSGYAGVARGPDGNQFLGGVLDAEKLAGR